MPTTLRLDSLDSLDASSLNASIAEKVSSHPLISHLSFSLSLIAFNSTKAGPGGWEDTSDLKLIAKKERYTKEEQ